MVDGPQPMVGQHYRQRLGRRRMIRLQLCCPRHYEREEADDSQVGDAIHDDEL